nr:hypothetical protein [uncultured Ligilactobacillus sp.]
MNNSVIKKDNYIDDFTRSVFKARNFSEGMVNFYAKNRIIDFFKNSGNESLIKDFEIAISSPKTYDDVLIILEKQVKILKALGYDKF